MEQKEQQKAPSEVQEANDTGIIKIKICSNCGTLNNYKLEGKGSALIGLILLFCFFIPGVIYFLWMDSDLHNICSSCGGKDTILDTSTPIGKQLYEKHYTK
jgi:hypothetical protein